MEYTPNDILESERREANIHAGMMQCDSCEQWQSKGEFHPDGFDKRCYSCFEKESGYDAMWELKYRAENGEE